MRRRRRRTCLDRHTPRFRSPRTFVNALSKGAPYLTQSLLETEIAEERALIERLGPQVILGDFRLSLRVSTQLLQRNFVDVSNLHWERLVSHRDRLPVPDTIWTRLGVGLNQMVFSRFSEQLLRPQWKAFTGWCGNTGCRPSPRCTMLIAVARRCGLL